MTSQSAIQAFGVECSEWQAPQNVSKSSYNVTEVEALACFQEKHIVLFEKVPHTSYSTSLASIVRIMLHEVQDMAAGLVHDHVVIEVSSKHRKALLDTSLMVQHPCYCQKLSKHL